MDSFDEFRQSLNKKPENTRSSLIEPQVIRRGGFSKNNSTCDLCRRQATSIEPESPDFELDIERRKTVAPLTKFTLSEQRNMSEDPSIQYFQHRTPFSRIYNSSGKPLHLSDFKNDMATEHNFDNTYNRTYGPSHSGFSQTDASSNLRDTFRHEQLERSKNSSTTPNFYQGTDNHRKIAFLPYDESGRTFNLTEFGANNSNCIQHLTCTNDPSIQNLNDSKSKKRSTHNSDNSRITLHHIPSEFFKTSCREFFQTPQCHCKPIENISIPGRTPEFEYGQKGGTKSTHPLRNFNYSTKELVTRKNLLFETLVKDHYYPGTIVDSVNGIIDFNEIAFGGVFGCGYVPLEIEKESVPMSLLEAFDLRIEYEQDLRDDLEKRKLFCSNEFKNEQREATSETEDHVRKEASERVKYWTHRDELKLASTIDIDLMTKVTNFPETPLTEAINCLLKAEKMNSFDRNVHLAEEAIRKASHGQQELAALKSTCSFKLDLRKDETKTTNSYEPLAIISYIGTTKPNN